MNKQNYIIGILLVLFGISLFINWNQSNRISDLELQEYPNWTDSARLEIQNLDIEKRKFDSLVQIEYDRLDLFKNGKIEFSKKKREILNQPCNDSGLYEKFLKQLYEESSNNH